jgi:hypothetical protein
MIGFNFSSLPFVFEYAWNIGKNKHLNLVMGDLIFLVIGIERGKSIRAHFSLQDYVVCMNQIVDYAWNAWKGYIENDLFM